MLRAVQLNLRVVKGAIAAPAAYCALGPVFPVLPKESH